jgi:hypothetical protein
LHPEKKGGSILRITTFLLRKGLTMKTAFVLALLAMTSVSFANEHGATAPAATTEAAPAAEKAPAKKAKKHGKKHEKKEHKAETHTEAAPAAPAAGEHK